MKFGLWIIVAAILGVFAAQFLLEDPGQVVIDFRGYRIEMSVFALALLAGLLLVAAWAIRRLLIAPRLLGEAAGRYRSARSGAKLMRGMIEIAEGNFARGEKLLGRAAASSDTPLFNYLQAARAAHMQGNDARRDEWLKIAYEETPEAANAVLLTQAEFQLAGEQYEQALATLRQIDENSHDHGYALTLLARVYEALEDYESLDALLPRLKKRGRVDDATLRAWTDRVWCQRLRRAETLDDVIEARGAMPKTSALKESVLTAYFDALIRTGGDERAEKELVSAINKDWRGFLVERFGRVRGADASKQLKKAEGWLTRHPEDPDLLLAAARLCIRNELWGKARSYLESVIGLKPSPEAYQVYGRLLNQLGESDAAADAFREGLGMVSADELPAIPHLKSDPS